MSTGRLLLAEGSKETMSKPGDHQLLAGGSLCEADTIFLFLNQRGYSVLGSNLYMTSVPILLREFFSPPFGTLRLHSACHMFCIWFCHQELWQRRTTKSLWRGVTQCAIVPLQFQPSGFAACLLVCVSVSHIPNLSNFASRSLERKVLVKTIPKYPGLLKLSFQLRSPNLSLQLYCFHSWCGVSRQCVGSAPRLRKIAPLCSRNVVFDAMSSFHLLKLTLDTTRSFVLRTCSWKTLSVKSITPNPSNHPNISLAVAKRFVKVFAGFCFPRFYQ